MRKAHNNLDGIHIVLAMDEFEELYDHLFKESVDQGLQEKYETIEALLNMNTILSTEGGEA